MNHSEDINEPEVELEAEGETMVYHEGEEYESMLSIYWCGFDEKFCGESTTDDVYENATHIILAYVNIEFDGTLTHGEMPTEYIDEWHADGKKVLIAVGGQSGLW